MALLAASLVLFVIGLCLQLILVTDGQVRCPGAVGFREGGGG